MSKLVFGVLSCALIGSTSIATVALAKNGHAAVAPDISVTAKPESVQQWSSRIASSLDRKLTYPTPIGRADYAHGVVKIKFHCSESGLPDGVALARSSRSTVLDNAALRAVRGITTLHPLPDGVDHDRPLEAWIVFADNAKDVARMTKSLEKEAALALAQSNSHSEAVKPPLRIILASR